MAIQELETKSNKEIEESEKGDLVDVPRIDAYTSDKEIYLEAEIPGVDKDSLEITVEKNTLKIRGKVEKTHLKDHELMYSEFGASEYYRELRIEESIDSDSIKAVVQNGLLKVTIPFKKPLVKKVKVQ